jgi:predicted TIM-barrel fold metal-dependent hydrolase
MQADLIQSRQVYLETEDEALLPIVDAHHHFWAVPQNPHLWLTRLPRIPFRYGDYAAICKDFLPDDYTQARVNHLVMRHVVMEGEWDPTDPVGEAVWMKGLAERAGVPHALAAQIWLDRDDVDHVLHRYQQAPLAGFVKSVRHKPQSVARAEHTANWSAPGSMRCPRWRDGYAKLAASGLMFELQVPWWHMNEAAELARDFPGTTLVVNHAGMPAVRDADTLAQWALAMARLANSDNVVVKISGLGITGGIWTAQAQKPVVDALLASFGHQRCMFASNYPVDSLVASLDTIWQGFKALTRQLRPTERLALFCDNAARVYGLG